MLSENNYLRNDLSQCSLFKKEFIFFVYNKVMKKIIVTMLLFSSYFLFAETDLNQNASLENFLSKKDDKSLTYTSIKSVKGIFTKYSESSDDYNLNNNFKNEIYSRKANYKISRKNLNLVINTNKNTSKKNPLKKDTVKLILESQNRLFDKIDLNSSMGVKLSDSNDYFVSLGLKKEWKNIYNIDYTVGQMFIESLTESFDSRHFIKLDKKINEYYTIQNYYEYNLALKDEDDVINLQSYIALNQKINDDELLIYKIVLNSDTDVTSYGINVRYKLTDIVL